MKIQTKIFLAILCLIIAIFFLQILREEKKIFPVEFIISQNPGFDFSTEKLSFGAIQQNQSATRQIKIENLKNKPVKISIQISKNIFPYLVASENNFYLQSDERRNVTFTLSAKDLPTGKYFGEITVTSTKLIFK
jgi:hypothetical protein